jgi:two-component system cell cycle sensor histidine kinase/response regulator CckA
MKKRSQAHSIPAFTRYKAILEAVPDIIMEVDEHKVYTWANRAGIDFFGDDVVGREAADFFIGVQDTYERVQPLFNGNEDIVYIESHQRRRDGSDRLLGWWCKVLKDKAGQTIGALSSARDITDERRAEMAIRESEERFRAIFDNSSDGIILARADMKFVMGNRSICEMLGCRGDELAGLTVADIHPTDSLALVEGQFQALLNGDIRLAPDIPVRRRNGTVFFADIYASAFQLNGKQYVAGFFRDTTDRNRMVDALRESEEHFRTLVEATPMGMHLYRVEAGSAPVFTGFNPAADKILGVDHRIFVNRTITDAFPSLAGTEVPDRYARAALAGDLWHNEQIDYKDDRIAGAFDVYAFQIKPGLMAAMFSDITERKRLEAELSAQREFTDRIMATSPVCIVMADREGHLTYANNAAERVLGLGKESLLSRTYDDPDWKSTDLDGQPLRDEDQPFHQVMRTGEPISDFQHAIEWPDGRRVFLSINGSPLRDTAGRITGVVFAIDDITARVTAETARRRLEEQILQSQKMESIGRLAGGVAHDLNNLLTPIIGYADYFLTGPRPTGDDLTTVFKGILGAAERAQTLTRQLLAFGRKQPLSMSVLGLNQVIESIRSLLERTLRENIRVRLELDAALRSIRADHSQIDQILLNLAANSQDALKAGGEVVISTFNAVFDEAAPDQGSLPAPGAYVVLSFADNGEGMDPDTVQHIFEPFFTTKDKGVGTGLGLATVYGIVQQHNASIRVYSEPGRGTMFRIYFPAVRDEAPTAVAPDEATSVGPASGRILLVEDNHDVRAMTQRILASLGYDVIPAENGKRALDLFKQHSDIRLVITDVIMPDLNGVALYQMLKSKNPRLKVLYMSGYTDDIIASHGLTQEEAPLITKPFTVRQLKEKVEKILHPLKQ